MLDKTPSFLTVLWWLWFLSISSLSFYVSLAVSHCGLAASKVPADLRTRKSGTHTELCLYAFLVVSSLFLISIFMTLIIPSWSQNQWQIQRHECWWLKVLAAVECLDDIQLLPGQMLFYRGCKSLLVTIKCAVKFLVCTCACSRFIGNVKYGKHQKSYCHFYSSSFLTSHTGFNFDFIIIMMQDKLLIRTSKDKIS